MHKILANRISDIITFLRHNLKITNITRKQGALDYINDLIKLLNRKSPLKPFESHKEKTLEVLDKPSVIIKNANPKSSPKTCKKITLKQ